jgi:3'-phosphoadenosine 5'-phosphosulfate sulfotransferase (PAPS reductase)/FAD synthetase
MDELNRTAEKEADARLDDALDGAWEIVAEALNLYSPSAVIGLFSGGHDSYTVTHFVAEKFRHRLTTIAHIDTGIGIPETQQFVVDRCAAHGWPLQIYRALENRNAKGVADPQDFEELVLKHGFPGPHGHGMMYFRLKDRQVGQIVRDFKGDGPVMFISGCRKEESTRRMGTTEPIQNRGSRLWVAPFTHFTGSDCAAYMRRHSLPKNPVKERLCMSGECLCGAFAKKNELKEIEFWYPDVAKRIKDLEDRVRANGFPWGWEEGPPEWWTKRKAAAKAGQVDAFEAEADEEIEMLCQSCHYKNELTDGRA